MRCSLKDTAQRWVSVAATLSIPSVERPCTAELLVDTGSEVTVVTWEFVRRWGLAAFVQPTRLKAEGLGAQPLRVMGCLPAALVVGGVGVPAGHAVYVLDNVIMKGNTVWDGLLGMDMVARCGGMVLEVGDDGCVRLCTVRLGTGTKASAEVNVAKTGATELSEGRILGDMQFMLRGVSRRRAARCVSRWGREAWEREFAARVHAVQVPSWEVELADDDSITEDLGDAERAYVTTAHQRRHVRGAEDFEAAGPLKHQFEELVAEFEGELFHDKVGPEPLRELPPMRIHMPSGTKPVASKPRRFSPVVTEMLKLKMDEMLQAGIIRPSSSEWSANVVPVMKSSGEGVNRLRVTIDLSRMNRLARNPKIPLPSMSELMNRCARATCFTTVDASDFYFQSALEEGSKAYTAFYAAGELYEFNRVPQGCSGSPGYCQRVIKQIVGDLYGTNAIALLDDVLLWARSPGEMLTLMRTLFERMARYGVRLKRRKCCFVRHRVAWMGMQIGIDGITPLPDRAEAIKRYPRPTSKKEVTSFTSLMQFYSHSLPGLAHTLAPLRRLQRKGVPFVWDEACERSFMVARHALLSASALAHMQFDSRPFYIITDASKDALGVVVAQRQGPDACGPLKAVRYLSRQTTAGEKKYPAWGLEMAALVYAVDKLRDLMLGARCVLLSDHRSLMFLFGAATDARIHEQSMLTMRRKLSKFPFTLLYVKGEHNPADALSRVKLTSECTLMDRSELPDDIKWALAVCRGEVPLAEPGVVSPGAVEGAGAAADVVAESAQQALAGVQGQRITEGQLQRVDVAGRRLAGATAATAVGSAVATGAAVATARPETTAGSDNGDQQVAAVQARPAASTMVASVAATVVAGVTVDDKQRKQQRRAGLTRPQATAERHPEHGGVVGGMPRRPVTLPSRAELVLAQQQDARVGLMDLDAAGQAVRWGRHLVRREPDGLVVVKTCAAEVWVPLVPARYRRSWLHVSHGAHVGVRRTREVLRRAGYWMGVDDDVKDHVAQCLTCAKNKTRKPTKNGRVRSYPAQRPFQQVQIDLVGPLPVSRSGNRVVLSGYDRISHWVELIALPDGTARRVAHALWTEVVCRYGVPEDVQSDRGRAFVSQTLAELATYMGLRLLHASAYSPQEQGGCERMHRVLGAQLRMLCQGLDDVWDEYLSTAAFVMRTSYSEALGTTPFHVMFGRHPRLPTDMFVVKDSDRAMEEGVSGVSLAERLGQRLRQIHQVVQNHTRQYQKRRYGRINDKDGRKDVVFALGTQVLLWRNRVRTGKSKKLEIPVIGPLKVVAQTSSRRYVLRHVQTGELYEHVKVDRIIPYLVGDEVIEIEKDEAAQQRATEVQHGGGRGVEQDEVEENKGVEAQGVVARDSAGDEAQAWANVLDDDEGDSSDEDVGIAQALEEEEGGVGVPDVTEKAKSCFKCSKPAASGVVCLKCGRRAHLACGRVRTEDAERLWICPECLEPAQVTLSGGSGATRTVQLEWPQSSSGEDAAVKLALSWNDVSKDVQQRATSFARRNRSRRRHRTVPGVDERSSLNLVTQCLLKGVGCDEMKA